MIVGVLAAAGIAALVGHYLKGSVTPPPNAVRPPSVALSSVNSWTFYGDARVNAVNTPGGFSISNGFGTSSIGMSGFASAAAMFSNLVGGPLDNSVPYVLNLRIKGFGGAKQMGITVVETNQDPNNIDSLFSELVNVSDGLEHTLSIALPTDGAGIDQIALHVGSNFGFTPLGNPIGSGVQILDASVAQPGVASTTQTNAAQTSALQNTSSQPSDNSKVIVDATPDKATMAALSTQAGTNTQYTGDPTTYNPIFVKTNMLNVTPLMASQERLMTAAQMPSSLKSTGLVDDAATKSHSVVGISSK